MPKNSDNNRKDKQEMSIKEELIDELISLILAMTPEQCEKFMNDPEVIEILAKTEKKEAATA